MTAGKVFCLAGVMLAVGCSTTPVYTGSGLRCEGSTLSSAASASGGPRGSLENSLSSEIQSWLGTPYVYGGESKSGVDCSGLTQQVFAAVGISIPRRASEQAEAAQDVSPGELRFGDLLFFNTSGSGISHVGVYVGNGFFVHASSSRGVVRQSIAHPYYSTRLAKVGRFL
ncbi:NlpC/P60 family protein [Candidatus Fermentibacteria bacterium]|nr:NlpC/P60 family protein [Candidatus Fermentibacteria bacterium]